MYRYSTSIRALISILFLFVLISIFSSISLDTKALADTAASADMMASAGMAASAQPVATPSSAGGTVAGFRYADGPGRLGTTAGPRTDNLDLEPVFSGGELRVLADETTNRQQLSMIFKSSDGKILVVDGGVASDSEHLLSEIKELGGYVDAWLITHPQDDHVGALMDILDKHAGEIDIRGIYYRFNDLGWYESVDELDSSLAGALLTRFSALPPERVHGALSRGQEYVLSEKLSFRVLNDPLMIADQYAVNNSGVMYDICMDGKHVIVLGDMGPTGGEALLSQSCFEGISCDFVQMSHHGQNGVGKEVYEKLMPKACIWPTPDWLYSATQGNLNGFMTYETKSWIDDMGITENYCIKDGDVTIR